MKRGWIKDLAGLAVLSALAGVCVYSLLKLQREDLRNSATLAQRRAEDKRLGKFYKSVQAGQRHKKGDH